MGFVILRTKDEKRIEMVGVGGILFQPLQAYCPLWGVKSARFWFSSDVGGQDFHHLGLTP